jgi:hypothetical protein
MKELMRRVEKCAPDKFGIEYSSESRRLVLAGEGTEFADIWADGSTVQNASGLMVLIERMRVEYDRFYDDPDTKSDNRRYRCLEDVMLRFWHNLSTQSVLEAFCEVYES